VSGAKRTVFYAILALIVGGALEIGSSAFLYAVHKDRIASLPGSPSDPAILLAARTGLSWLLPGSFPDPATYRRMTRQPAGFFAEDPEQGYRANPGRYVFRYSGLKQGKPEHLDAIVTINPNGTRFSGSAPVEPSRRIFVLGDSYVFGDGVNDEQTFAFLLQAAFPDSAVELHALAGYSWANALVTMDRIRDRVRPGDAVVLGYAAYYKERHVAAPSRLRSIRDWMASTFPEVELDPKDRLIRARLDDANRLALDTIPMHCKFDAAYCNGPAPDGAYVDRVSRELLRAIASRTVGNIHLLHMFGPKDDPVLRDLPANVRLVAATPQDFSYVMQDNIMGLDDHGGPYWHYAMYSKLKPVIAARQ
jgi:hypothetical protein